MTRPLTARCPAAGTGGTALGSSPDLCPHHVAVQTPSQRQRQQQRVATRAGGWVRRRRRPPPRCAPWPSRWSGHAVQQPPKSILGLFPFRPVGPAGSWPEEKRR
ncbi:hypothetical protein CDD83_2781 [Cordyceps sp. RAO-2017]|nr:hypothetical protein CDD83_2781 [Cordyceps sp. RAO-2017]